MLRPDEALGTWNLTGAAGLRHAACARVGYHCPASI
jgi:hypothetical protein